MTMTRFEDLPLLRKVAVATTLGLAIVSGLMFVRVRDPMLLVLGAFTIGVVWLVVFIADRVGKDR